MAKKKKSMRVLFFSLLIVFVFIFYMAWGTLPIITGFGAKNLCSCVFVSGRNEYDVKKEELGDRPLSLGSYTVNYIDSSVTGNFFGLAKKKAIYRERLGCTLINDFSESKIRSQTFLFAQPFSTDSFRWRWPNGNLLYDSIPAGVDINKINKAVELPFLEPNENVRIHTRAVLVVYKGQIIGEKYSKDVSANTKLLGWSMGKSITSALIGILVQKGKLNIEDPAPVPEWQNSKDPRHGITLKNLLQQTSGLDFEENYSKESGATNMLFKKGDMGAYAASSAIKNKPGEIFYYSSGNSNILSRIIRHTIGDKEYGSFAVRELFSKIGMNGFVMEPDASGTYVGSSYVFGTARDYARFGLLYLNNGIWEGEQILPTDWVEQSVTFAEANAEKEYGFQFWLNGFDKHNPSQRVYPAAPKDMFYADGYGGQRIYIIPSKQLVIVRMGLHKFDENSFLNAVLTSVN